MPDKDTVTPTIRNPFEPDSEKPSSTDPVKAGEYFDQLIGDKRVALGLGR